MKQSGKRVGPKNPNWGGERHMDGYGYVLVYKPGHARANNGRYVREHVLLAEAALGKPLPPSAEIHHADEDKANNAPGNLVICQDRAYHMLLHKRTRALDATGDPNAMRCGYCHGYDRQEDIRPCGRRTARHRSCFRAYQRRLRASKRAAQ